jgi:dCMP deaminase
VGAVIVAEKRIVSTGYNGPPKGYHHCENCDLQGACIESIHAEANAIAFAASQGIATKNTILYCTHSPCVQCARLIIQAGIIKVYYLEQYRDNQGLLLLNSLGVKTQMYVNEGYEKSLQGNI